MEKSSKKTIVIDTNIVLRYLLSDDEKQSAEAATTIENNTVFIPNEVICEVCYVLDSVYNAPKNEIKNAVQVLLDSDNIKFDNKQIIKQAFSLFASKKFDIVDCMLFAYYTVCNYEVKTFDKKLKKLINEN